MATEWCRSALARRVWGGGLLCAGLLAALPSGAYEVPKLNALASYPAANYPNLGNFDVSPLVETSDGNLYGVSAYGGINDIGYVYKVSRSNGQIVRVHDFAYADGATPRGALIQASDGFLYGTTQAGGANQSDFCIAGKFYNEGGCGTLFRVGLDGSFRKLHDFYTEADGYQASPAAGVVQAADGNLYGMAVRAFPTPTSSIYRYTSSGQVAIVHLFAGDLSEGYLSSAELMKGADGQLYGTTANNGAVPGSSSSGCGTVFKAGTDGSFQTLHVFTGAASGVGDGCVPSSRLRQARDGRLYGTTNYGGYQQNRCLVGGCGIVYSIASDGTETVLHRFAATAADGEYPQNDGLVQAPDGTLYGATGGNPYADGFVPPCYIGHGTTFSCGTLYRIDTRGRFKQLFVFGDGDGAYGLFPHASLTLASDGNVYGTTFAGGGEGYGTVYRIVLDADTPILSIDGFTPAKGNAGTQVSVFGNGFTGATELTFGNGAVPVSTPFSVLSDTEITTQVPVGTVTSAIGLTAPRGTTYSPVAFKIQRGAGGTAADADAAPRLAHCARTPTGKTKACHVDRSGV